MDMSPSTVLAWCGGTAGLIYLILFLLRKRKRVQLKGKVVLITGANSGLGKACATVFYSAGCKVILAGRNLSELQKVKEELQRLKSSGDLGILQVDLSDLESLGNKGQEAKAIFDAVDILVNNAGVSYRGSIEGTNMDVHQMVMNVNYFGQIALTKALLPVLKERPGSCIVAVSSVQGRISIPYRSAYAASKHAMQAFFDCLRAELWDTGVGVCVVNPGYIQTSLSTNALCGDGSKYGVTDTTTASGLPPETVAQQILKAVECGKPEIFPATMTQTLAITLRILAPSLFFWIMAHRAKKQSKVDARMHPKSD
ncbi:dehydrogenase/reductase SDR family member 7B-like [Dreissena polymorpha]|uniref:Ketoreductase domain-containing protein n=1 Tax=Dreissena polymorpha TaxID=45954 RepID=A0A9D4RM79_DREPO|nr:dehydrogenase/reductase SDR family member 7B-like [Dreissena polymorpha]KAH3871472.1 hypothetical protein DPMN_034675 [Dreissena polymorpha]